MVSMAERGRSADLVKVGCGRACGRACGRGSVELDRKAEIGPCGRANEGRGPPTAKTNPSNGKSQKKSAPTHQKKSQP